MTPEAASKDMKWVAHTVNLTFFSPPKNIDAKLLYNFASPPRDSSHGREPPAPAMLRKTWPQHLLRELGQTKAAPARRDTGFADLPLELRQCVYDHLLPPNRHMRYPLYDFEERRDEALAAMHPAFGQEMRDWMYKHCSVVLWIFPDEEADLPENLEWHRFMSIIIVINFVRTRYPDRESFAGVKQNGASLVRHPAAQFPTVEIRFFHNDNIYSPPPPGTDWYDIERRGMSRRWPDPFYNIFQSGEEGSESGYEPDEDDSDGDGEEGMPFFALKTIGPDRRDPIATLILNHFLQIPPCKSISVRGMYELGEDWLAEPSHWCFDVVYWFQICWTLEKWLKGKREGLVVSPLTEHDDGSKRPMLERMAYTLVGEGKWWYEVE